MSRLTRSLLLLCFMSFMSVSFGVSKFKLYDVTEGNCWMTLNAKKHFETMDGIDEKYKTVRDNYQKALGKSFAESILKMLLKSRGIATRELFRTKGITDKLPSGLNLGGLCMMKLADSILFLHRIKLRNNTFFRVNMLDIDLVNMVLTTHLSLHDLHLTGAYGRVLTDKEPGILYYTPTYGEVEFLLKDVSFKAEGRLRLMKDRLWIELCDSKVKTRDALMTYTSDKTSNYMRPKNLDDILERMKTDLQKWLKDYFNDFFMLHPLSETPNSKFQEAEKTRITALNDYADYAIRAIVRKIRKINATAVKIPTFTLRGSNKMVIKLYDGALRGLDTMYRRSVATGKKDGQLRKVNTVIGFSSLKVVYQYEAQIHPGMPPLSGVIILTSDDLTGHLTISLINNPEAVDINIDSMEQMKAESLTVEGSANRLIATYKHVLQHHIIAIMTNTLHHQIKMIRSLPGCVSSIKANIESGEAISEEDVITKNSKSTIQITGNDTKQFENFSIQPNNNSEQTDITSELDVTTPSMSKEDVITDESGKASEIGNNEKEPNSVEDDTKETEEENNEQSTNQLSSDNDKSNQMLPSESDEDTILEKALKGETSNI